MMLSVCVCCLQKCVAIVDKEQIVIRLWSKLFSLKIKATEAETPCVCFKCYLRLKLSYAYRKPFVYLYKYFESPNQPDNAEFVPDLNNVTIILVCPICFVSQPSAKHIYEHLSQPVQCDWTSTNMCEQNGEFPQTCNPPERCRNQTPIPNYYCHGACGASFKRKHLLDAHQAVCKNLQKTLKIQPADASDSSIGSQCNSPNGANSECDDSAMLTDQDSSSADENKGTSAAVSKVHTASKLTRNYVQRKITPANKKSKYPSTLVKGTVCKSLKSIQHSGRKRSKKIVRQPSQKIKCKYCLRLFSIGLRIEKHEANFCSLRPNRPMADGAERHSRLRTSYKRYCTICGKWVTKLKVHMLTHTHSLELLRTSSGQLRRRLAPKMACKYCHKQLTRGRKKHETTVCPLRPNHPPISGHAGKSAMENDTTLFTDDNATEAVSVNSPASELYSHKQRCPICGKWVNKLKLHLLTHSATPQFECQHCHKRFKNLISEKNHQTSCPLLPTNEKSDATNKAFVCDTCGKSFTLNAYLSQHKKHHIKVPCSVCNVMISKASVALHMNTVHDNASLVCDDCGKMCKNRYALNAHIARYHQENGKRFECETCNKTFLTKQQLKVHRRSHEVGQKNYSCELCGLTFFTATSLSDHIRTVHEKSKVRTCSVCGLILSSSSTLKIHERQHTGVKPYACDVCGKRFTQKPPLNRHLRSQHKIMPTLVEKCPVCEKMFASKMVLKSHMVKTH